MTNIIRGRDGMNILGQGGKIILFMLPALVAAILVHASFPRVAALPAFLGFLRPVGAVLLIAGVLLWAAGITQLLVGFSHGRLVTTGAYGIVRNPMYASFALFVLPAVSFITMTWVYLVVAAFLYAGVMIFIGREEGQLGKVFGGEYDRYKATVHRMVPFRKP